MQKSKTDNNKTRHPMVRVKKLAVKGDWKGQINYYPGVPLEIAYPCWLNEDGKVKWEELVGERKNSMEKKVEKIFGKKNAFTRTICSNQLW